MNIVYPLFAASSWPVAVLLALPALIMLFGPAFYFGRTSRQRVSNMVFGTLGAIGVMCLSAWYLQSISKTPPLRRIDLLPIVVPVTLAVGSAVGVAASVLSRNGFTLLFCRHAKEKALPPPQDSSSKKS